jgi:UDP-glucose 4-epimerase
MKNILLVTGGAGFVGSNLIEALLKFKKFKIISLDNYSSGKKTNHIENARVKYFKGNTKNISNLLNNYKNYIHTIFHFGEFARIYQSFKKINECFESNIEGSSALFNFALENKIKLIYSATSASLGNRGNDMNLSPYAFTKAKNLELLENLKKWFNFNYETIYFYNVYGPRQICRGDMATVVGIFEDHYKNGKKLPVVRPGTQTRRFTHVQDTVAACIFAWKKNKNRHYSVSSKRSYSIIELAKLFKKKIKFIPQRKGERFASALTKMNLNNKIFRLSASIKIKDYVSTFLAKNA